MGMRTWCFGGKGLACLFGFLILAVSPVLSQIEHVDSTGSCLGQPLVAPHQQQLGAATAWGTLRVVAELIYLHIYHDGAVLNCCNKFYMEYQIDGENITAIERDSASNPCSCECTFNVHSVLKNMTQGRYIVTLLDGTCGGCTPTTIGVDTAFVEYEAAPDNPEPSVPREFSLSQNYPNPFNPATSIRFTLAKSSGVTIEVFNIVGRKVATIAAARFSAGDHTVTWNGADDTGSPVSSGVYLYRLTADEHVATRKMILLK